METALITGISGMDGSYLSEHLLEAGLRVCGIIRRNSTPEFQTGRLEHLRDRLTLHYGDVTDPASLNRVVDEVKPDYVFNLAAQSHVRISSDVSHYTAQTNAVGSLNMLNAVRCYAPHARFYQASSSEMFGSSVDSDGFQRETTPMHPVSPYGIAKLFGYWATKHFRAGHDLFACNGILFNHSSHRRGSNFVESKVVKTAVQIARGDASELMLGNLDSKRDWGHSKDYTRAMWLMLQQDKPDDYVISTGMAYSVREMVEHVFSRLDLDYRNYVKQDARFMRPQELPYLKGDASKARRLLDWRPTLTYHDVLDELIEHWQEALC